MVRDPVLIDHILYSLNHKEPARFIGKVYIKFVKILLERNVASPNYINNEKDLVMTLKDYCRSLEVKIDETKMNYDNREEFDIIDETL